MAQQGQRVRKSSPVAGKQGPLRATIPISGVLKQSSGLRGGISPAASPPLYFRARGSPDHSSGQRSPGASSYKGKSKSTTDAIRRTASLDTIYLKGQWPKDHFYWNTGVLHIDKATQTDDNDWLDSKTIHRISEMEDKVDKFSTRPKIRGSKEPNRHSTISDNTLNSSSQTLTSCILSPTLKVDPVMSIPPLKPLPKPSMRSSVEGLNQEIERIVLKTGCETQPSDRCYDVRQPTPEGHRAPLAELLRSSRSRSVNTQTPQDFSCHSSGDSHGSSPENETGKLGTSPQINRFLAREPPDGCEKVRLKSMDERRGVQVGHTPQPTTFKLKPSLGSAFHILQPELEPAPPQDDAPN